MSDAQIQKPVFIVPPSLRSRLMKEKIRGGIVSERSVVAGKNINERKPVFVSHPGRVKIKGFNSDADRRAFYRMARANPNIITADFAYGIVSVSITALWGGIMSPWVSMPVIGVSDNGEPILGEPSSRKWISMNERVSLHTLPSGGYVFAAGSSRYTLEYSYSDIDSTVAIQDKHSFMFLVGLIGKDTVSLGAGYLDGGDKIAFIGGDWRHTLRIARKSAINRIEREAVYVISQALRMENES